MSIFSQKIQNKQREDLQRKVYEIRSCITKFFEDLQISKGSVELPAWMECQNLMKKLKIDIEHPKIVNYYYKKIPR